MDNLPTKADWDRMISTNGNYLYRKMFYETNTPEGRIKYPPLFTLKPREYKGLPSVYLVYMDSVDEYDAATKIVPNMREWDHLKNAGWFLDGCKTQSFEGLKVWREHMKQRDNSLAKAALQAKVATGDVTAAKAILAENKTKAPVGRKNKKTVAEKETSARIVEFKKKQG